VATTRRTTTMRRSSWLFVLSTTRR
jgi:hypothetical protein